MKKAFIILLFVLVLSAKSTNAQTSGVPDTLAYLQSIVANKAQYIGQPFSNLLNNLQIQVKYFHPRRGIVHDITKETSTRFAFYFPATANALYLTYPSLEIYWQQPLNANQSNVLWNNNNGGGWATVVSTFYSTGIIADIRIRE